jgi:hypothetical protein
MRFPFVAGVLWLCVASALCLSNARAAEISATPSEKIELRLRLQKGQSFDQVIAMEQKTSQTANKYRMDMLMRMRFGLHTEVMDVAPDGASTLRMTYRTVAASMQSSNGMRESYDSTRDKNPSVLLASIGGLAGKSLDFTMSPRGQTLKVEGMEAIIKSIMERMKVPAQIRAQVRQNLQKSLDEKTARDISYAKYPESPVGVGDTWSDKFSFNASLPLTISTNFLLLSRDGKNDRLHLSSKISTAAGGATQEQGNMKIRFTLSGHQNGMLTVEEATGITKNIEINQRIAGKISIQEKTPSRQSQSRKTLAPSGLSFPIYIKTTVRGWTIEPLNK